MTEDEVKAGQPREKPLPLPDDPCFRQWPRFSRLQKLAWFWRRVNECIEKRLEPVPESQRLTLRIEDLDSRTSADLAAFCGMRGGIFASRRVVRDKSGEYAMEWDEASLRQFNEIAAPGMRKYGYDLVGPAADS